jgi:hypothetical protein
MALRPARRLYQHRGHKLKTAPAVEPVTADEFRAHIIEDDTSMPDASANGWIEVARQLMEDTYSIAFITQVWELTLDNWPQEREPWWDGVRQAAISELQTGPATLEIPRFPLASVDTITVYGTDGTGSTVTIADVFDVDAYSTPGRLALKIGATWPVALRHSNAILVEYTAGYGDAASDVPAPLRLAVKQVAAFMYNHRGDGCDPADALAAASGIMGRYDVRRL